MGQEINCIDNNISETTYETNLVAMANSKKKQKLHNFLQSPWVIDTPGRAVERLNTSEDLGFFLIQAVATQSSIKM